MRCCCTVLVAALALALTFSDEASAQKKPKPPTTTAKKHHAFHGVVVKAHHHKDAEEGKHVGYIVVKHHTHNKKTATDIVVEKTFHITAATTFERVDVKGKGKTATRTTHASSFKHVHHGQHVNVHHTGELATDVKIVHHHNK